MRKSEIPCDTIVTDCKHCIKHCPPSQIDNQQAHVTSHAEGAHMSSDWKKEMLRKNIWYSTAVRMG